MRLIMIILGVLLTAYCFRVIHDYLMGKGPEGGMRSFVAMVGEAAGITMIMFGAGVA